MTVVVRRGWRNEETAAWSWDRMPAGDGMIGWASCMGEAGEGAVRAPRHRERGHIWYVLEWTSAAPPASHSAPRSPRTTVPLAQHPGMTYHGIQGLERRKNVAAAVASCYPTARPPHVQSPFPSLHTGPRHSAGGGSGSSAPTSPPQLPISRAGLWILSARCHGHLHLSFQGTRCSAP